MKRSLQGAVAMLALCPAVPALAADYFEPPELRPAYPDTWEQPDDSIRFEFGAAYWYSWGEQDAAFGPARLSVRDQTHIGELHGKIEDLSTQTYVAGRAGIGLHTTGTYDMAPAAAGNIGTSSHIGYAGADFGWLPLGTMTDGFAVGGLVGYHYWKEAPDIGTAAGEPRDDLDIHALRLGVKGTAGFDMFDVQAEVAAVPYAHISGRVDGATISGRGYGVMAEGMVGFQPTENLTLRVGGRAWYLDGNLDATLGGTTYTSTYASLFRYGLRTELTGKF